jgi:dienelactone hydrolase
MLTDGKAIPTICGGVTSDHLREPTMIQVSDSGLIARFFSPETPEKVPAILILGGSSGGIVRATDYASRLAEMGYAALAVAYFGVESLPSRLEETPLEYFKRAIDWLASQPCVESNRIGVLGISKGAEAALLIAASYADVRAVVAIAPSHVVFQSIDNQWYGKREAKSSWTLGGQPILFVPYKMDNQVARKYGFALGLYHGSLQDREAVERALIRVERINGPILLLAGSDDALWPSAIMCERINERLRANNFPFAHHYICYKDAGHDFLGERSILRHAAPSVGGTPEGNTEAHVKAWQHIRQFLDAELR